MATTKDGGDPQHVWDMARKIKVAMLTNWDGTNLNSRPMSAHIEQDENAFYFLADKRSHKDEDMKRFSTVNLAFADASDQKYVAITGEATIHDDRAKVKELWSVWAKAWWDSPDDPNIVVLKIVPTKAEYWDTPGSLISNIKMVLAAATNSRPDIGENRKVEM